VLRILAFAIGLKAEYIKKHCGLWMKETGLEECFFTVYKLKGFRV
jgi:hypothetical protein